jgi:predicted GNAT superfamily acetyltransferase
MYILIVDKFLKSEIVNDYVEACHILNQNNVPEVGDRPLDEFKLLVENSDYNCCIVENKTVVGFVICFQDNKTSTSFLTEQNHKNFIEIQSKVNNFLYIDRIAVHENYRGQNIGKEIYQHVEKFAIVNNIESLTAEINLLPKKNEISFKFHEKYGFREFSTKKYSDDYEVSFQKKNLI